MQTMELQCLYNSIINVPYMRNGQHGSQGDSSRPAGKVYGKEARQKPSICLLTLPDWRRFPA